MKKTEMNTTEPLPWENSPVSLSAECISNPYLELDYFFSFNLLPNIKRSLREWLLAGIEDQHKWKYKKLVELIHGFKDLECLVEALWLIHQAGTSYEKGEGLIRFQKGDYLDMRWSEFILDRLSWSDFDESDFYTNLITKEEKINPYIVVHALFKEFRLSELRSKLRLWCNTALTNPWEYTAMDKVEMVKLYQTIDKLIEAAFVINELQLLNLKSSKN